MNEIDLYWYKQIECKYTLAEHLDHPKYRNMWIPMKEALYDIDYTFGRNKMITYLKIKGILDLSGKPVLGNKKFDFFKVRAIKKARSYTAQYYNFKVYFISAIGILEIRRMIKASRSAGANI